MTPFWTCTSALSLTRGAEIWRTWTQDFSTYTTDVTTPNTELHAKSLAYYPVICRDELNFYKVVLVILPVFKLEPRTVFDPGGFTSVDCNLVNITSFLLFTDLIKTEMGVKMFFTGKCDGMVWRTQLNSTISIKTSTEYSVD